VARITQTDCEAKKRHKNLPLAVWHMLTVKASLRRAARSRSADLTCRAAT
jgi:hypothetical protein